MPNFLFSGGASKFLKIVVAALWHRLFSIKSGAKRSRCTFTAQKTSLLWKTFPCSNAFVRTDIKLCLNHVKVLKIGHSRDTFNSTIWIIDWNDDLFIIGCEFLILSRPHSKDGILNNYLLIKQAICFPRMLLMENSRDYHQLKSWLPPSLGFLRKHRCNNENMN